MSWFGPEKRAKQPCFGRIILSVGLGGDGKQWSWIVNDCDILLAVPYDDGFTGCCRGAGSVGTLSISRQSV